jgi:hypothetical protein
MKWCSTVIALARQWPAIQASRNATGLGASAIKPYEAVVPPTGVLATKGAWHRGWRVVSTDGDTLDIADPNSGIPIQVAVHFEDHKQGAPSFDGCGWLNPK